jgi:hypothetical protein
MHVHRLPTRRIEDPAVVADDRVVELGAGCEFPVLEGGTSPDEGGYECDGVPAERLGLLYDSG